MSDTLTISTGTVVGIGVLALVTAAFLVVIWRWDRREERLLVETRRGDRVRRTRRHADDVIWRARHARYEALQHRVNDDVIPKVERHTRQIKALQQQINALTADTSNGYTEAAVMQDVTAAFLDGHQHNTTAAAPRRDPLLPPPAYLRRLAPKTR